MWVMLLTRGVACVCLREKAPGLEDCMAQRHGRVAWAGLRPPRGRELCASTYGGSILIVVLMVDKGRVLCTERISLHHPTIHA
jgi:hypothetical protein